MGLIRVTDKNRERLLPGILGLEAEAEYPLGTDFFKIDHGRDYFSFFKRLGDAYYYVWLENNQVAAVAAAILRKVPLGPRKLSQAWYLSDLKVLRDFRGQNIPLRMLGRGFLPKYFRCRRGYAISMNSVGLAQNRVERLLSRFRWAPLKKSSELLLWSLDERDIKRVKPVIEKYRGPVGYLSLHGVKDIVLRSTGQPMPLVHVQFGPLADPKASLQSIKPAVHMFCSPENDRLSQEILALGYIPSSTATVISHRMANSDWTWVLTSDI